MVKLYVTDSAQYFLLANVIVEYSKQNHTLSPILNHDMIKTPLYENEQIRKAIAQSLKNYVSQKTQTVYDTVFIQSAIQLLGTVDNTYLSSHTEDIRSQRRFINRYESTVITIDISELQKQTGYPFKAGDQINSKKPPH